MKTIILVPTSHIATESHKRVRTAIEKEKPDIIAVELDLNRYLMMQKEGQKNASSMDIIRQVGFFGFLVFSLMKKLQQHLGKKTGILPGSEMLKAVSVAEEKGLEVAFIDNDIRLTFVKIGSLPWKERLKMVWLFVRGFSASLFLKGTKKEIDLKKIPEESLIEEAMEFLKKNLPTLYRALVTNRNKAMAARLARLSEKYERIVVVIGAGHKKGLKNILEGKGLKVLLENE